MASEWKKLIQMRMQEGKRNRESLAAALALMPDDFFAASEAERRIADFFADAAESGYPDFGDYGSGDGYWASPFAAMNDLILWRAENS